jgi:PIN domain nuclease of toxin-antitoxin system
MPRLLLDTYVFLWWVNDASNLTEAASQAISNTSNECFLSMASCWEMAIKSSLGKLRLTRPIEAFVLEQLRANHFSLLNFEMRHMAKVEKLPFHHRDPFDRLLIAQAITNKLTLITAEKVFADYDVKLLW